MPTYVHVLVSAFSDLWQSKPCVFPVDLDIEHICQGHLISLCQGWIWSIACLKENEWSHAHCILRNTNAPRGFDFNFSAVISNFLGTRRRKKKKKLEASSCSEVTKIIYSINLMSSKLIYFPSDVLGVWRVDDGAEDNSLLLSAFASSLPDDVVRAKEGWLWGGGSYLDI